MILMLAMLVQTLATSSDIRGDWINQRQTAVIRIFDCPSRLCGVVIWSAPTAQGDAARGGTRDAEWNDRDAGVRAFGGWQMARPSIPA